VEDAPAIGALKVRAWRAAYAGFMSRGFLDGLDFPHPVRRGRQETTRLLGHLQRGTDPVPHNLPLRQVAIDRQPRHQFAISCIVVMLINALSASGHGGRCARQRSKR
jgi:hypothetical protein